MDNRPPFVFEFARRCALPVPLADAVTRNMGKSSKEISANAGYCSEANLAALNDREISSYITTGQARRHTIRGSFVLHPV